MSRDIRSTASLRGIHLSIVVPLFNEVATIVELHRRITAAAVAAVEREL